MVKVLELGEWFLQRTDVRSGDSTSEFTREAPEAPETTNRRPLQQVMYEHFFGLRERPFELVPNPRFLYLSPRGREAVANLRYGLAFPRGLTLLLGDAGTGKTTFVTQVVNEIDASRVQVVLVSNPTLTRAEFYEALAQGFGLNKQATSSKTRFLGEFRAHLEARHRANLLTAMVLDEAQSLSHELLEEVRLLSNIDTPTSKLLNVILAGQPELADRLNDPALRHLKQRISLRCELLPLDHDETAAYIAGRLRIAGGEPASIFSREAIVAIHEISRGIPRTINVVCDNALISGFAAQTRPIVRSIVDEISRDFDLQRHLLSQRAQPDRSQAVAVPPPAAAVTPVVTPAAPLAPVPVPPAADRDVPVLNAPRERKGRFHFF